MPSMAVPTYLTVTLTPTLSVWPHLFRGAGHEKRTGEQLKWSLAFRLYIGSFLCAQLPGPVHTARLGRVFFCVFRRLPATGNARSPTVMSRVRRISSSDDDDERSRRRLE